MNKIIRLCLIFCLLFMVVLVMSCNHNVKVFSQSEITFLPTPTPPIFSSNTIQANKPDSTEKPNEEKLFIASETCKKIKNRENRLLCDTMVKVNNLDEDATIKEFSYLTRRLDLNNDGLDDAIIWINDRCGTSGCPILIFQKTKTGFQRVLDEFAWTPIIRLKSAKNGWSNIAIQIAGGGVDPHFEILQFNGNVYKSKIEQNEQPEGEIILDKNWKQTFFGPISNQ